MRDLPEVIGRVLIHIPSEGFEDLRSQLTALKNSAEYTDRSAMPHQWARVAAALGRALGEPDEQWKRQIAAIMQEKPLPRT